MKKRFLLLSIMFLCKSIVAQKVINNPNYISKNFSANVTKVEVTGTETILHFNMKGPIGSKFLIAKLTYIENAAVNGKRLYITKSEGVNISQWNTMSDSDEVRYKLYFPPLEKDVKKINYGEANPKGHWFIYKLDISKNGERFLNPFNKASLNGWKVSVGYPSPEAANAAKIEALNEYKINATSLNNPSFGNPSSSYIETGENMVLPEELPKEFFGNWYDKYGTLMLITTPDYIVSNSRIEYYRSIQRNGENKFVIRSTRGGFEVLNLDSKTITIRTDKLSTLKRKPIDNTVPLSIKGDWLHWGKIKKIKVTDNYFYNDDKGVLGVNDIVKSRIDHVAKSDYGNIIWFVLYNEGNYNLYKASKIDGEFVLRPRGFVNARYKKVKN
ncbi:hypothetical protein Q4Q35_01110 [Flavivirga aquimarina]|uniref:Uncharacterized protein n=1 Tax=Flavivirga aquimarina TaxID=2027862 RepID=A0ABT8W5K3_9FLAO|nr:hypothetical protein [Flavivirga aquimarina]MDO5968395.1 hypothetical protein [Flavivirga aquimarina]